MVSPRRTCARSFSPTCTSIMPERRDISPNSTFYVHEIGDWNLAMLVDGATRVYGEKMEELWSEVRPVPEERLVALNVSQAARVPIW